MEVSAALDLIRSAVTVERSGGFLVVGDLKSSCDEFVSAALALVFPTELEQVKAGTHPDIFRLEPQGRSRTIKVERGKDDDGPGLRDGILEPMSVTSFSGGWKVALILGADRLQPAAANVLLKSLEEPTPRSLYFLLTDQPDAVLATIVSRCQRIDLGLSRGLLEGEEYARVARVFASAEDALCVKSALARELAAILKDLKDAADDADVPQVRKAFFRTLLSLARTWLLEDRLPRFRAEHNLEAIEEAFRQSERFMPDEMVLSFLLDRMTLPG